MAEQTRWRIYPTGAGSPVRAVSAAVAGIPLVAMLLILPFLAVWYVADRGAFGVDATGQAWLQWALLAVGVATLAFAFGTFAVSLLNLLRTVLTIRGLRRVVRHGGRSLEVPHPRQWAMAADWRGFGLIVSSLLTTAVLAFPGILTPPVRPWIEGFPLAQDWRFVGIPVIAIALVGLYQRWRTRALRELERRWPERAREAAVAAAKARVPHPPRDSSGEPTNPAQTQRRPLDAVGDRINTVGYWVLGIAVLAAVITLPVGTAVIGGGAASGQAGALLLLSSVLLVAIAIVLFLLGGVLQNAAQSAELGELLAAAQSRTPAVPTLAVISRHWRPMTGPWVDFLGLLGALVLLLALPVVSMSTATAAAGWGTVGVVLAVVLLLAAVALDLSAAERTRERRNLVLRRWPTPDPTKIADVETRVDEAVQADVQRYRHGQRPMAPPPAHPYSRGGSPGASAEAAGGPYPPVAGQPTGPASPPGPPPRQSPAARRPAARRARELPRKLRHRGLGDLYH